MSEAVDEFIHKAREITMKNNGLLIPVELQTDEFIATFEEYRKMRRQIKKPMTPYAEELAIARVAKLSENNPEIACEMLDNSIFSCWTGIFPLIGENKNGNMSMSEKVAKGLV